MTEMSEITLKTVCCTCLSVDRKLTKLCSVNDGVNNLFFLLSYNFDAYEAIFNKGAAQFSICWECEALMVRLCEFRDRACLAQQHLAGLISGWTCVSAVNRMIKIKAKCHKFDNFQVKLPKSLSKLEYYQNKNNYEFVENELLPDNFIDCGPDISFIKTESDTDDTPLANLFMKDEKPLQPLFIEEIKKSLGCKEENINISDKKNKNSKGVKYDVFEMIEEEILESRRKLKLEESYINASCKCESCVIVFKDFNDLEKHNMELHVEVKRKSSDNPKKMEVIADKQTPTEYLCKECNASFDTQKKKYKHVQKCHREGFKCSTCGKSFSSKNNLSRHEQLHAGPLPREPCPTCGKLIRQDFVKAHALTHTNRQSYTCESCDRRFVSRASYENHLKNSKPHTVKDFLKYICDECSKGYKSRAQLQDHINYQHMRRTMHKCPICNKALATRRCVTRHVRRAHQGIKEDKRNKICKTCGKAFRDKKSLREHEWIHSGERPFSCATCGRTFRQRASLYTHTRRLHSDQTAALTQAPLLHMDDLETL